MRPFYVYDRWGKQVGTLPHPLSATHKDRVNGEDSLTLELPGAPLTKGQRILWRDKFGAWHEHMVSDVSERHEGGRIVQEAYCESSIAELLTDYLVEVEPKGAVCSAALSRALEASGSRWTVGRVEPKGTADFSWYHVTAYDAVTEIVEAYGGELEVTIVVEGDVVRERRIDILQRRGSDLGRFFCYGHDLVGIERTVGTDPVYTALYGYGKGVQRYDEETGEATGGYSRKITFGEINGGLDWVGDEDARLKWGVPDGRGGVKHAFGKVEFSDCEDAAELKERTLAALATASQPQVTYEGSVLNFGEAGFANGEDCRPGDTVYLRDPELGDLRVQGRVLEVDRDELSERSTKLTLGNIRERFTQRFGAAYADLQWLKAQAERWDSPTELGESYVDAIVARLNTVMNVTGGYTYIEPGMGIVTYDRPREADPTMAIQITGAGFRIANSKLSDGTWNWRTFGTGAGFTADEINVGTIRGGSNTWNLETGDLEFDQGIIRNADGSNYWNLTTGELRLASTGVKVDGNQTLSGYVNNAASSAASGAVNFRSVFNALTHNGVDEGFFIDGDRAYVNASYVRTGMIEGGSTAIHGHTLWDLDQGYIQNAKESMIQGYTHSNISRMSDGKFQIIMDVSTVGDWFPATFASDPHFHYTAFRGLQAFLFSAPYQGYVGYQDTASDPTSLSAFYKLAHDTTVTVLTGASSSGGSAKFTSSRAHFRHGWLTSVDAGSDFNVNL